MKTSIWLSQAFVILLNICMCWSVCDLADHHQLEQCAKTKDVLESALVSSDVNLYILEEVFLSSKQVPPTLLEINYIVRLSNSENNEKYYIDYPHHVTWTSSPILASINLKTILALQPGIVTGLYWFQDIVPYRNITLTLEVPVHELPPMQLSRKEDSIQAALESITPKLQQYAALQKEYNSSNNGFVTVWSMTKYMVISAVLLAIFSMLITGILSMKKGHCQVYSTDTSTQLFRSVINVITFVNISEGVLASILLTKELSSPKVDLLYCLIKGGDIFATLTVPFAVGTLIGCIKHQCHAKRSSLCCLVFYWIGICNFYIFIFLASLYLIPMIILIFVQPAVISTIVFVSATIFCLTSVFALCYTILQRFKTTSKHGNQKIKSCNASFYLILSMMTAIVIFPVLITILTNKFAHTSELLRCTLLTLPSIMLTITGIIALKDLTDKKRHLVMAVRECDNETV